MSETVEHGDAALRAIYPASVEGRYWLWRSRHDGDWERSGSWSELGGDSLLRDLIAAATAALGEQDRIAALDAERDAARAEAGRLRGLLESAQGYVAEAFLLRRSEEAGRLMERIAAALTGSGEQQP